MAQRSNLKPASGTARQDRLSQALDPASAPVDGRNYEDLMTFALDFSRLLNFYDSSNQPVADWQAFFKRDISFLLARIVTTDLQKDNHRGWALQNAVKAGRENTREILKTIYQLASRLDEWYGWAVDIAVKDRSDNELRMTLESIIERDVRYQLKQVEGILGKLRPAHGSENWSTYWSRLFGRLRPIWHVADDSHAFTTPVQYDPPIDGLLAVVRALHLAHHKLQQVAKRYLNESQGRSDHAPHTALYLAFAKLLLLLRDKINTLTDRHLDFYYREVLRLKERESSPDRAYVSLDLAPDLASYTLPAGSRLSAGKDPAGKPIVYATDHDLTMNRAHIASTKALYLSRTYAVTGPEKPDRIISISAFPDTASKDSGAEPSNTHELGWPTFGINEVGNEAVNTSALHAELGFIVESPVLLLEEGERNVAIGIAFAGDGKLEAAFESYQAAAAATLDAPTPLELLLADAFLLYVSGEKGWIAVTIASFRRHAVVGTAMEIEFTLRSTDPAITSNPLIAPGEASRWPLFKLTLNPQARVYAYRFFCDLEIETVEFRVSVSGVQKMQLRNELGLLDPSQPFPVFGPTPSVGSYLLVAHRELCVKTVNHSTIVINWFNLPKPPSDLESYYAGYGLGIRDDSFKLRLSIFGVDTWQTPEDGQDLFPMFARDYDRSGGLLPVTVLATQMPDIPPAASEPLTPQLLSEADAPRGSVRLELAEPDCGFGQQAFPGIMAQVAIKNAKSGKKGPQQPLPNPPFAPVAKSLTLDYEAADRLDLRRPLPQARQARFYGLYPFGYLDHQGRATPMFPRFDEQGHLFLGIGNAGPRTPLTLLFEMCDTAYSPVPNLRAHHEDETVTLRWRYLSGNEWKEVPPALMLSDTTMGLTRSGIVKISLPADITTGSSPMPSGLCWIEAAAPQVSGVYWSRVISISTQAVSATRICDADSDLVPPVMLAGSITQLVEKLPQIKAVRQPFATMGGRSRENMPEFRARVSERLRHKDRAIQAYDFERLILERFPKVGQVKCIGSNNSRGFPGTIQVPPGTLYLAVTPRLEDTSPREPRLPQYMLKEIEHYVRGQASLFVEDVHVISPVYETLKVFALVEFSLEGDGAGYIDDLDKKLSVYLQPWRSKPFKPMPIGSGQVQSYDLAQFIQQRPYVVRLHDVAMLHTYQTETGFMSRWVAGKQPERGSRPPLSLAQKAGAGAPYSALSPARSSMAVAGPREDAADGKGITNQKKLSDPQRAGASAPWSVLVPAAHHSITIYDPRKGLWVDQGVRNLTVGSDLVLGPAEEPKEDGRELRYFLVVPAHPEHKGLRT